MTATGRLGDLVSFLSGCPFKSALFNTDGVGMPLARIRDVVPGRSGTYYSGAYEKTYVLADGDYLIGMDGEFNLARWRGGPALLNQRVCKLDHVSDPLDLGYLARFLPSALNAIEAVTPFATVKHLSIKSLREIEIPLPSLGEQRRIAAILDQVDDLRTKRREALAHLDDLTQSIFLEMFGDKRDWPVTALKDLVATGDRINYGVVQPGDEVEGGVPLIRVSDLRFGRVDRTRLKLIDPAIERKYTRSRIRGNEILITCVGSTGVIAITSDQDVGSNVARAVTRVPIEDPTTRQYVAEHLRSARVQRYFKNELRTVSQPTLNGKQIAETEVPMPPMDLQDDFVRRVRVVRLAVETQSSQRSEMDALFASLQSRAFTGEL